MIVWISKTLALAIHERQLAEHGGSHGLRDEVMLDSALARPQQLYTYGQPPPDLADLAASLAFGLIRNHPFVDGNKRTAHVCYRALIALNDGALVASEEEKYAVMIGLSEGSIGQAEFADWLRPRIVSKPRGSVQETPARYRRRTQASG